jgi:hypothetical protein
MKMIPIQDGSALIIALCADNRWWYTVSSENADDDTSTIITAAKEKAEKDLEHIQRKIDVYNAALAHIREN